MRTVLVLCLAAAAALGADLRVLRDEYPRAFFFRSAEGMAANPRISYERWEAAFERLSGIEGKALDEEVPGRGARNAEFFTRFKQRHPDQLVMLHFNGDARDPRFEAGEFFAGHWLYLGGAKVLSDVPARAGENEIRVSDARLFRTGIGRYRNANEDLVICETSGDGQPDWNACEQLELLSADARAGTLRVKRGAFGTAPRAFAAGRAWVAAHATEGPWGGKSHLLWLYNYSTRSPRDRQGRQCADVLAEDLARRFAPGGALAAFDGLEFDVLMDAVRGRDRQRGADAGTYGDGVIEFCRKLRAKMGPHKLILADGMSKTNQRAFGILNGIESEGFPHLRDPQFADWSGGLNRHFFWNANAAAPVFNYINHKFNEPDAQTGLPKVPELPMSVHRLVFAAAAFTNAAVCYSLLPKAEGELVGIWDELRTPWLGKPLAPAVRLAEKGRNLLPGARDLAVTTGSKLAIPLDGPDLYLTMRVSGKTGTRPARLLTVTAGERESMTWFNERPFTATFYFPAMAGKQADLEFTVEGGGSVTVTALAAYARPDAIYRQFERGVVLANPSPRPYTFDMAALFGGRRFRRIRGVQDPKTNSGAPAGATVTLAARDALFLQRQ